MGIFLMLAFRRISIELSGAGPTTWIVPVRGFIISGSLTFNLDNGAAAFGGGYLTRGIAAVTGLNELTILSVQLALNGAGQISGSVSEDNIQCYVAQGDKVSVVSSVSAGNGRTNASFTFLPS
jgi:hypothetical protein